MKPCPLEDVLEACLSPEESASFRRNCETFLGLVAGKGQPPSGLFSSRSSDGYFSPGLFPGSHAEETHRNGLESKEHLLQLLKSRTQQNLHLAYKPEMFCFYQTMFSECPDAPSHPLNSIPWRLMQLYQGEGRFFEMSTNAFVVNSMMDNPSQPTSKDNAVLNSPLLTGLCGKEGSGCECYKELLFSPDCWAKFPHVSPYLRLERQLEIRAAHNSVMRCLDAKGVEEHLMSMMKMNDPHFRHVRVPMGRFDNGTMVVALSVKVCIPTFRGLFRLSKKKDANLYNQVNRMAFVELPNEHREHCVPHNPWHSDWSELPNLEVVHPGEGEIFRYTLKDPERDTHLAMCASAGVLPPQMTTRCLLCGRTKRCCKCPDHIIAPSPMFLGLPDAKMIENRRKRECRVVVDAVTLGCHLYKCWIDTAYIAIWSSAVKCAKQGKVVVRKLVEGKMHESEEKACHVHIVRWLCLCPGLLLCQSPDMQNFMRLAVNPDSIAVKGIRRYINPRDDCHLETHFTMDTWLRKRVQAAVSFIELEREGGSWVQWNNVDVGLFSTFYDGIPTMGLLGAFKSAFGHNPTLDRSQWSQGNGVDIVDEERALMVMFGHRVPLETQHHHDDDSPQQWRKPGSVKFFQELYRVEGILPPFDHPDLAQIMETMGQSHDCRPWVIMDDSGQRWARVSKIRASSGKESSSNEECVASSGPGESETRKEDSASSGTKCQEDDEPEDPDLPRDVWCDDASDTISDLGSGGITKRWRWEEALAEEDESEDEAEEDESSDQLDEESETQWKETKRQRVGSIGSNAFDVAFLDGYEMERGGRGVVNDIRPRHLFLQKSMQDGGHG